MDPLTFIFTAVIMVGSLVAFLGWLTMRPLPEGSLDKWLRILLIALAALIVFDVARNGDGARAIVLTLSALSGVAATQLTVDRGEAAVARSFIAVVTACIALAVLALLGRGYVGDANWLVSAVVIFFGSLWLVLIPAGIAGWLAADARAFWESRAIRRSASPRSR